MILKDSGLTNKGVVVAEAHYIIREDFDSISEENTSWEASLTKLEMD